MTPETPEEEKGIEQAPGVTPAPVDVPVSRPVEGELLPFQREDAQGPVMMQMESYSGPIPHPATLKGYAEIDPSLPARIVAMAEKQQGHEHAREKKEDGRASMGIYAGGFMGVLGFGATCFAVYCEQPWVAVSIATVTTVALVYTFVFGSNVNKEVQIEALKRFPQTNAPKDQEENEESPPTPPPAS